MNCLSPNVETPASGFLALIFLATGCVFCNLKKDIFRNEQNTRFSWTTWLSNEKHFCDWNVYHKQCMVVFLNVDLKSTFSDEQMFFFMWFHFNRWEINRCHLINILLSFLWFSSNNLQNYQHLSTSFWKWILWAFLTWAFKTCRILNLEWHGITHITSIINRYFNEFSNCFYQTGINYFDLVTPIQSMLEFWYSLYSSGNSWKGFSGVFFFQFCMDSQKQTWFWHWFTDGSFHSVINSAQLRKTSTFVELDLVYTFFFLNDLFLYLAIDTVFHPSGVFKMAWKFLQISCLKMV